MKAAPFRPTEDQVARAEALRQRARPVPPKLVDVLRAAIDRGLDQLEAEAKMTAGSAG